MNLNNKVQRFIIKNFRRYNSEQLIRQFFTNLYSEYYVYYNHDKYFVKFINIHKHSFVVNTIASIFNNENGDHIMINIQQRTKKRLVCYIYLPGIDEPITKVSGLVKLYKIFHIPKYMWELNLEKALYSVL